jgi:hypothetical protein
MIVLFYSSAKRVSRAGKNAAFPPRPEELNQRGEFSANFIVQVAVGSK